MADLRLFEELAEMNRERPPERLWFAGGAGAEGSFRPYMDLSDYTAAPFLSDPDRETAVKVRFSTAAGSRGSADTLRDNRGLAVKFLAKEGEYDFLGSSLPVFYIRDPAKFPALLRSLKPRQDTDIRDPSLLWEFAAANPEALHILTYLYSEKGLLKSFRSMDAYCVVPQVWQAVDGTAHLVRCRWQSLSGGGPVSANEAEFLAGFDPDVAARDLYDAIGAGRRPAFELQAQFVLLEEAAEWEFDLSDPTKIWPEEQIPVVKIGKMVLTEKPEDHLEQVERLAFSPGDPGPGMGLLKQDMTEAMAFACKDSQRHRLGEQKGFRRKGRRKQTPEFIPWEYTGKGARSKEEDHSQVTERLRRMGKQEREGLLSAMAGELLFVENNVQRRIVKHFCDIHEDFGSGLAKSLGL